MTGDGPLGIAFVAGDLGAANAMVPVMRELAARGHQVSGIADAAGVADTAFGQSGVQNMVASTWQEANQLQPARFLVVGTSASATDLERECSLQQAVPVALFSDSYFNHANPVWRAVDARWWLAIDEGHAASIRALHAGVEHVIVSGQPVFDEVLALIPHRETLRLQCRDRLALSDSPFVIWWSSGIGTLADEDLRMASRILDCPQRPLALLCAMHPKLDRTVGPGYIERTRAALAVATARAGARWVEAGANPGIELCLAADVLVAITSTEDVKSTLIGGPPVVHLLGPDVRRWMEQDLLLTSPHYLPDIEEGLSVAAYAPDDVAASIERALGPALSATRETRWRPPAALATTRAADIIADLAAAS